MKVTIQELTQFAKAAGVADVEVVEEGSDFNLDTALQSIDEARSKILRPKFEQEISAELEKKIGGKVGGTLERILVRETGVDAKLFTDGMKDDEKIKLAIGHKLGQLDGDKQEIAKQIDELVAKHNDSTGKLKEDYEKQIQQAKDRYIDREVDEYFLSELKDAPLLSTADRSIAAKDLKNYLRDKYHVNYDEATKKAALFQKGNPTMPALNEAGTSHVNILDEAKSFFEPRGIWQKDMRNERPDKHMPAGGEKLPMVEVKQGDDPAQALYQARQQVYANMNK